MIPLLLDLDKQLLRLGPPYGRDLAVEAGAGGEAAATPKGHCRPVALGDEGKRRLQVRDIAAHSPCYFPTADRGRLARLQLFVEAVDLRHQRVVALRREEVKLRQGAQQVRGLVRKDKDGVGGQLHLLPFGWWGGGLGGQGQAGEQETDDDSASGAHRCSFPRRRRNTVGAPTVRDLPGVHSAPL